MSLNMVIKRKKIKGDLSCLALIMIVEDILSTQYKCEICKLYTCHDCFEIIGHNKTDEHTCNPDSVKSAELIRKDTKPCPTCGVRIFKISGCDQMWCTECEIAFSWSNRTVWIMAMFIILIIINGSKSKNNGQAPRNPGDILCGGLCNYHVLRARILDRIEPGSDTESLKNMLLEFHRFIAHIDKCRT